MIDDIETAPCDFKGLPFLKWREKLCPPSKIITNCFKCSYYRGDMTWRSWPDHCSLYTGDLWREYRQLELKKEGSIPW